MLRSPPRSSVRQDTRQSQCCWCSVVCVSWNQTCRSSQRHMGLPQLLPQVQYNRILQCMARNRSCLPVVSCCRMCLADRHTRWQTWFLQDRSTQQGTRDQQDQTPQLVGRLCNSSQQDRPCTHPVQPRPGRCLMCMQWVAMSWQDRSCQQDKRSCEVVMWTGLQDSRTHRGSQC